MSIVLLKTLKVYVLVKNNYNWVCLYCLLVAYSWYTPC